VHKPIDSDMLLSLMGDVLRRPRGRSRKVQIASRSDSASVG
jgi:hypothetical protein